MDSLQFKINGLNHNLQFEKDKIETERARVERLHLMDTRMREAQEKARNSVFDPFYMKVNIRDKSTTNILDPNHMVFTPRKK